MVMPVLLPWWCYGGNQGHFVHSNLQFSFAPLGNRWQIHGSHITPVPAICACSYASIACSSVPQHEQRNLQHLSYWLVEWSIAKTVSHSEQMRPNAAVASPAPRTTYHAPFITPESNRSNRPYFNFPPASSTALVPIRGLDGNGLDVRWADVRCDARWAVMRWVNLRSDVR